MIEVGPNHVVKNQPLKERAKAFDRSSPNTYPTTTFLPSS
jgi:hypothetical protein